MPSAILTCLAFILTPAVLAHADFSSSFDQEARLSLSRWETTHVGGAHLAELAVDAALETAEQAFEMPEVMAGRLQTLLAIEPATKKSFRLRLNAEAGNLRAVYVLKPKLLSGEHAFQEGFESVPELHHEFTFTLYPLDGGAFRVVCRKKGDGQTVSEFLLNPVGL